MTECLAPEISKIDPLESGIQFFEEQKKFNFLFVYQCNKVFLNHVDSFNGRHILRYIGCREFSKPNEYEEVPGEGSLPSIVPQPTSSSLKSSVAGSDVQQNVPPDVSKETTSEESKPIVSEAVKQLRREVEQTADEDSKDSLYSILGGLLNYDQVAVLRSLPNKLLRAGYLKNILNQIEPELEVEPEEHPLEIVGYEIAGTMKYCDECLGEIQMFLKERVRNLKAYLPTLLSCSTVIFDISRDPSQIEEARWALRAILCSFQYLQKKSMLCFNMIKDVRKFILISSAMTWENTDKMKIRKKPVSEDNLTLRKPHPLFKEHKHLEQEVIRAGLKFPELFKTYVLASGIPYGYEEDRLNYLFDLGWKNEPELPLLGDGHNSLPIIHIEDLAMLVFHCMVKVDVSPSYFLAIEKNPPTLLQITEGISKGLTTGKTTVYPIDQPLPLNINIHEDTYAMLTSELLLEPTIHKLDLPWKYNMNMVHNMAAMIDEYIEYRNLCPFKILVGGPPASGKTNVAQRIALIYDLKYISIMETINNYVEKLEKEALEAVEPDMLEAEDDEEEEDVRDEELDDSRPLFKNELEEIKHSMDINNGVPEDSIVIRILKKRLEEKDVLNHGYVIDGWPETSPQAQGMFGKDEEEEDELPSPEMTDEEEEDQDQEEEEMFGEDQPPPEIKTRNINIQPNFLIQLEADCDEMLFRVLAGKQDLTRLQPSSIRLAQRMEQYRDMEKMCCRAFDYFDNKCLDLKILRYDVGSDPCPFLGKTLKHILNSLGPPTNTGYLRRYLEEYKMIRRVELDEKSKKNKERAEGIEKMDVEYFRSACQFMDKWVDFKDNVVKEKSECGGLDDQLLPQKILETTVRALVTFKQASPDDHLEFLAEYFLKEYEEDKGRIRISESECNPVAFRRCVATVLERCDPLCLSLLPQAVNVIMKYRRFALARGTTFPPLSCRDEMDGAEKRRTTESEVGSQIGEVHQMSSNESIFGTKRTQDKSLTSKSLAQLSLDKLVDLLIKTDPIWKQKLTGVETNKKLAISEDSLKILLEQLRQLSCEIQYRLKKRGVREFDRDSTVGSCGEWPHEGPEQECSAEIRTQHPSQPSLDTRKNLENLMKADRSSSKNKSENSGGDADSGNRSSSVNVTNSSSIKSQSEKTRSSSASQKISKKPSIEASET